MRATVSALLLFALPIVVLVGCGGGGGGEGDSSSTASQARPAAAVNGEKSIEEFGREAEGSGRIALLGAFHAYLMAIAVKDDPSACGHLSAPVRHSLRQFVARKDIGCPQALSALLASNAAAVAREQAKGHITKARVRGDRAFVVFHAPGAKLFMLTMVREDDKWKVATVAASVLVPSAATLGQ